jgi:hypothetical protein
MESFAEFGEVMCFSATASVSSAAVLLALGSTAGKLNQEPRQRMFVALPFIFGFQQLCEGFVWLSVGEHSPVQSVSVAAFLFFATAFWPLWLPWAVYAMEKNAQRKKILKTIGMFGTVFFVGALWVLYKGKPHAAVVGHSLAYTFSDFQSIITPSIDALIYLLTALAPFFISSERKVKVSGYLILGGLILSHIYKKETVASVWCFFAAITSLYIVYEILKETRSPVQRFFLSSTKPL